MLVVPLLAHHPEEAMSERVCIECRRRPPQGRRRRCVTCQLRHEPIGDQVAASRRRLAMVPLELRVKRSKKIVALSPAGTSWCAGCQSFRDLADFGKGATECRACKSAKVHAANVEKTYGITGDDYETLLERQGGKCAICRARPKAKRLAVDHDHKTGAVRGLLCSRCNHDLLGSAWDSIALATSLWHYLNTPPASGSWITPEAQPRLMAAEDATRPTDAVSGREVIGGQWSIPGAQTAPSAPALGTSNATLLVLPVGSEAVAGRPGVWRYFVEPGADAPF